MAAIFVHSDSDIEETQPPPKPDHVINYEDPAESDVDDECVVVATLARDPDIANLPHARRHCPRHPFEWHSRTDHCDNCYCAYCEVPVSQCAHWDAHAGTSRGRRRPVAPPEVAATAATSATATTDAEVDVDDDGDANAPVADVVAPTTDAAAPAASVAPAAAEVSDDPVAPYAPTGLVFIEHYRKTIRTITLHGSARYFLEPVPWAEMNLPAYPDVVKHPMDFGTVSRKLMNGAYLDEVALLRADVDLIFSNARLFNGPDNWIIKHCITMENRVAEKFLAALKPPHKRTNTRHPTTAIRTTERRKQPRRRPCDHPDGHLGKELDESRRTIKSQAQQILNLQQQIVASQQLHLAHLQQQLQQQQHEHAQQ
jgi:hypothetical protein